MKRILLINIFILLLNNLAKSQQAPNVFLHKDSALISKEYLLKTGKLFINDTIWVIDSFVYVIAGSDEYENIAPAFGVNKGCLFSEHFINEIKKRQAKLTTFTFQDIYIHNKKEYTIYSRKLAQTLAYRLY